MRTSREQAYEARGADDSQLAGDAMGAAPNETPAGGDERALPGETVPAQAAETPSAGSKRPRLRAVASGIIVATIIALFVAAGTFVLSPYGSKSQLIWSEFRQQENLDAVCLGSSLAARSYDPAVMDAALGTTSFNMGTPSQYAAESYLGLREAIEHHQLKRVYYGVDYANFIGESKLYPARVYENEKWKGDGFLERFADLTYMLDGTDWLFDERSLNWLFPWTESQPAGGVDGLVRNAVMRLDGTTLVQAAETNEPGWLYHGQGYGNYERTFDYNGDTQLDFCSKEKFSSRQVNDTKLRNLADMADLCAEHGIEFIVFVPALPEFSLISLKDYYVNTAERVRATVEEHGGSFYDFNVGTSDFYQPLEGHFEDYQHYNYNGSQAFSAAFAKLMQARAAGQDTSSWFTTYEERLASIDHISTVQFSEKVTGGTAKLRARCFAGTNVKVEYQFQAAKRGTNDFVTVRDWSEKATFNFTPEEKGSYLVRVNARQVGTDVDFERCTQHTVGI